MASYRLRVALTYNTTPNATTATSNLNTALVNAGRPEQAVRDGTAVALLIVGIPSQAQALALRDALTPAWGVGTRSQGKASLVMSEDVT